MSTYPTPSDQPAAGGLLSRAAQGLRSLFPTSTAVLSAIDQVRVHPVLQAHAVKLCSAAAAVAHVRSGDHIFVGTACATPRALVGALEANTVNLPGVELVHFLTDQAVPHNAQGQVVNIVPMPVDQRGKGCLIALLGADH